MLEQLGSFGRFDGTSGCWYFGTIGRVEYSGWEGGREGGYGFR